MSTIPYWGHPLSTWEEQQLSEDQIEEIEKVSLRMVVQAFAQFAPQAWEIFGREQDDETEIAEDITREALDSLGGFVIRQRLFGTIDYKRARWLPTPYGLVPQAFMVDSKAEKQDSVCRLQMSQLSLRVRYLHRASGQVVDEPGTLPPAFALRLEGAECKALTTVILAHYYYAEAGESTSLRELRNIRLIAMPHGRLADRYCPTPDDHIWNMGPHSPTRGEAFRARVSFAKLRRKCPWRVQTLEVGRDGRLHVDWVDVDAAGAVQRIPLVLDSRPSL